MILNQNSQISSSPRMSPEMFGARLIPQTQSQLELSRFMKGPYGDAIVSEATGQVTPVTLTGMLEFTADVRREQEFQRPFGKRPLPYPETNSEVDYTHEALKFVAAHNGNGEIALQALKEEQYALHKAKKFSASRELNPVGTEIVAAMNKIAIARGTLKADPIVPGKSEAKIMRKLLASYDVNQFQNARADRIEKTLSRLVTLEAAGKPVQEQEARQSLPKRAGKFLLKLIGK